MALIKCKECGKEISDKATTCIHCGCPIEKKEETVEIIFIRNKIRLFDSMSYVYIDDNLVGKIKSEETLKTTCSIGEHTIKLKSTSGGTYISSGFSTVKAPDEYNEKINIPSGTKRVILNIHPLYVDKITLE